MKRSPFAGDHGSTYLETAKALRRGNHSNGVQQNGVSHPGRATDRAHDARGSSSRRDDCGGLHFEGIQTEGPQTEKAVQEMRRG